MRYDTGQLQKLLATSIRQELCNDTYQHFLLDSHVLQSSGTRLLVVP